MRVERSFSWKWRVVVGVVGLEVVGVLVCMVDCWIVVVVMMLVIRGVRCVRWVIESSEVLCW